jgi:hypothetical protein
MTVQSFVEVEKFLPTEVGLFGLGDHFTILHCTLLSVVEAHTLLPLTVWM